MPITIEVIGLKQLRRRMRQFPQKYNDAVRLTLKASLVKIWENVPSYPKYDSPYKRTGSLGRSLGSGMGGGKSQGQPDIFKIFEQGGNIDGAEFGTRLDYAPHVIGEQSAPKGLHQAEHMGHWWTIEGLAKKSKPEVIKLFKTMAKTLARFLEGKGLL